MITISALYLSLLLLTSTSPTLSAPTTYKYPSQFNDTSARLDPFFMYIAEVTTPAYANKNIQLAFTKTPGGGGTNLSAVLDSSSIVGEFVLRNGSLQVASTEGYYAELLPLPTTQRGIIRRAFTFTKNGKPKSRPWSFVSVSNDGISGLLNSEGGFAMFNGFVICNATKGSYVVEYQSSENDATTPGCVRIALHTSLGPPY